MIEEKTIVRRRDKAGKNWTGEIHTPGHQKRSVRVHSISDLISDSKSYLEKNMKKKYEIEGGTGEAAYNTRPWARLVLDGKSLTVGEDPEMVDNNDLTFGDVRKAGYEPMANMGDDVRVVNYFIYLPAEMQDALRAELKKQIKLRMELNQKG